MVRASSAIRQIERTVGIQATEIGDWQAYLDAGAEHIIVMIGPPFDLDPVRKLLEIARSYVTVTVLVAAGRPAPRALVACTVNQ